MTGWSAVHRNLADPARHSYADVVKQTTSIIDLRVDNAKGKMTFAKGLIRHYLNAVTKLEFCDRF